jgi:hypothetical protein
MKENGITWRSSKDIKSKIEELQKAFNKIENWKNQTGAGILNEEDGENKIRGELYASCWSPLHPHQVSPAYITKKFKYYYDLEQTMGDRVGNRPVYASGGPTSIRQSSTPCRPSRTIDVEEYHVENDQNWSDGGAEGAQETPSLEAEAQNAPHMAAQASEDARGVESVRNRDRSNSQSSSASRQKRRRDADDSLAALLASQSESQSAVVDYLREKHEKDLARFAAKDAREFELASKRLKFEIMDSLMKNGLSPQEAAAFIKSDFF